MLQENPWHTRITTHRHHRWFKNIVDYHGITLAWLEELKIDQPTYSLNTGVGPELRGTIQSLEKVIQARANPLNLDLLLDDTLPDDLLKRLEHAVLSLQALVLRHLLDRFSDTQKKRQLISQLQQCSWNAGRSSALRTWPECSKKPLSSVPALLSACEGFALNLSAETPRILSRRITAHEAQLELLHCPHQSPIEGMHEVGDELCDLQLHWARGFAHALSPIVFLEQTRGDRCSQRWALQK